MLIQVYEIFLLHAHYWIGKDLFYIEEPEEPEEPEDLD